MPIKFLSIRRVTWAEDNLESERYWAARPLPQRTPEEEQREAEYWATKTIAERVIAGWELADREDVEYKLKLEREARLSDPESGR